VVNDLVNGTGTTYFHRISEKTNASVADLARANLVARENFGSRVVLDEMNALENSLPADVLTRMRQETHKPLGASQ